MDAKTVLKWGALAVVAFIALRWMMGAFSSLTGQLSVDSYPPDAYPYNAMGLVSTEPRVVTTWAPYGRGRGRVKYSSGYYQRFGYAGGN